MNRLAIRALGLTALLVLAAASAWAGSDERKGTSGATELLIPVGARGSALGAASSNDVSGAEATFWNPAGLASLEGTEALFAHTQYFAGMKVNYAAVAAHAGGFGVIGLNAKVLSVGEVQVTTEAAPEGTGELLNPTFTVLGLSWARAFTDRVNFGGTVNFVNESIRNMSANGVAFDFGVQYATGWNGLKLGMVMKNFGTSMQFHGDDLDFSTLPPGSDPSASTRIGQFTTSNFEMPSYFTLSAGYDMWRQGDSRLTTMAAFQNNNFIGDDFVGGAEWSYKNTLALRGSWFGQVQNQVDAAGNESVKFQSGDDLYSGVALGGGFNWKAGTTSMAADVSWRPVRQFFDDVVELGLKLKF